MAPDPGWVADPHVAWQILLAARLRDAPDVDTVAERVAAVEQDQGWLTSRVLQADEPSALLHSLAAAPGDAQLGVGVAGPWLGISAHHSVADGLALVALLGRVAGVPVSSSARGVGDRPPRSGLRTAMLRRLGEVAFRPPARIAASVTGPASGESLASATLAGGVDTARLVHAGVAAVSAHNAARGRRSVRVAVAVGVSRSGGSSLALADDSALLRLRGIERASVDEIRQLIRSAPTEPVPGATTAPGSATGRAMAAGVRLLAPRLGSTLLVSHLGAVKAPGVEDLAFYHVTGGGS